MHPPTTVSDRRTGRDVRPCFRRADPRARRVPGWLGGCMARSMVKPIPLLAAVFLSAPMARAAEPGRSVAGPPGILRQLNGALSQLADRVSPAVVQIQVTGYGPASGEDGHPGAAFIVRQHGVGSGV